MKIVWCFSFSIFNFFFKNTLSIFLELLNRDHPISASFFFFVVLRNFILKKKSVPENEDFVCFSFLFIYIFFLSE